MSKPINLSELTSVMYAAAAAGVSARIAEAWIEDGSLQTYNTNGAPALRVLPDAVKNLAKTRVVDFEVSLLNAHKRIERLEKKVHDISSEVVKQQQYDNFLSVDGLIQYIEEWLSKCTQDVSLSRRRQLKCAEAIAAEYKASVAE